MTIAKKIMFVLLSGICLAWGTVHAGLTPPTAADEADIMAMLTRLETRMAEVHSVHAEFVQRKNLAVFDEVLVIRGHIYLKKPGRLAWHVTEPMRYALVITDDTVLNWFEDANEVQKVSLSANPIFKTVIKQMRQWFSGTYTTLVSEYGIEILDRGPIRLKFIPLNNTLAADIIDSVIVAFEQDERYIRRITILEKSGDSSDLMFVNTQLNAPLDDAVWEVKPRVP